MISDTPVFATKHRYIIEVAGGVEPTTHGPFGLGDKSFNELAEAINVRQNRESDSLIWIEIDKNGRQRTGTFGFD